METITDVLEITSKEWYGYNIVTTKQTISVHINNSQLGDKDFGVMLLPGHDIRGLQVKSVQMGTKILPEYYPNIFHYKVEYVVVNIETNMNTIQLVAWNNHHYDDDNMEGSSDCLPYFPHEVRVEWEGYSDIQKI